MPGRSVLVESFCLEADGKATLAELVGGSIVDSMGFRHDGWWRLGMDRHDGRCAGC